MPRPISKIVKFPVGANWPTIGAAVDAATAHSAALLANGDTWSENNVILQYQGEAAGVLCGILTPSLPTPDGASFITFVADYWLAPPSVGVHPPVR
jgi:hypothetical protein